ncbi:6-hydroxymethylpterin diphosphokinase MptE-like protein [Chloroflexota bacterium]
MNKFVHNRKIATIKRGEYRKALYHYLYAWLEWQLSWKGVSSALRIRSLRGKHRGERCFIIGNGPSLNNMDLSFLKKEITFGLNRIYLLFPRIGFSTSYYVSINQLVIEQFAHDLEALQMPKFIGWRSRDKIRFSPQTMFLRGVYDGSRGFSKNPAQYIWEGATVTYVAMQLASYLGFQQVILVGVDHSFSTKGKPHKTVRAEKDDNDHFSPEYFGKGTYWQLPDLEASEKSYWTAKEHFEQKGCEILDATIGGKLQVFQKVNYYELIKKCKQVG